MLLKDGHDHQIGTRFYFSLSEIMEHRWLELLITQTHVDSPLEFKPLKFYCSYIYLLI